MKEPVRFPEFKAGATLQLPIQLEEGGAILPLAGADIESHLRDESDKLIANLVFVATDEAADLFAGHLTPETPNTAGWPEGDLYGDVSINRLGIVMFSETFIIPVKQPKTHA